MLFRFLFWTIKGTVGISILCHYLFGIKSIETRRRDEFTLNRNWNVDVSLPFSDWDIFLSIYVIQLFRNRKRSGK